MRPDLSAGTLAHLENGFFETHWRVQVANADGTLIDLSDRPSSVFLTQPSPDATIGTARVEFVRDLNDDPATSLAPLIASDLNVDDAAVYAPLLQLGRRVVVSSAHTDYGAARPLDADFDEQFRGRISHVSWGGENIAAIDCNDQGGELQLVKSETAYAYEAGTATETAAQDVLDNNGFSAITLNAAATSTVLGSDYAPGTQRPVWEQVQALASSIGRVCWWRYQADGAADLVLFAPDRSKVLSDFTFPRIMGVNRLDVDEGEIFNVIRGEYSDADGVRRVAGPVENATSIAKYGGIRRVGWVVEDADSVVRTSAVMDDLLDFAASDLADPDVIATYKVPIFLYGEVSADLYTFPADDIHYDSAQVLAPFAIRHIHRYGQEAYSEIDVRGAPSGGSGMWRTRRQNQTPAEPDAVTQISNVVWTEGTTTGTLDWGVGAKITESWIGYAIVDSPATNAKWDAVAAGVLPVAAGEPPVTLTMPTETSGTAQLLLVQIEARYEDPATGELVVGDVHRVEIRPKVSIPAIDDDTGELVDGAVSRAAQVADGILGGQKLLAGAQKLVSTVAFTATDNNTATWGAGTITLADGTAYSITAGTTGNMAAPTFIYLAPDVSVTVLQTSTTATDALGDDVLLIAYALPIADAAQYAGVVPVPGAGNLSVNAGHITGVTLAVIQAVVGSLSAITADIGEVHTGLITNAASNPTRAIRLSPSDTLPGTAVDYIDLAATGTDLAVKIGGLEIQADGTTQVLDEVAKTRRISHHGFRPFSNSITYTSALNNTSSLDALSDFACPLPIPVGATITAIRFRGAEGDVANDCDATLYRQEDGGTNTAIQAVSIQTATTETRTETVSPAEVVDETYTYIVHVEMNRVSGTAPSFQWFEVDYTVPDYRTTL